MSTLKILTSQENVLVGFVLRLNSGACEAHEPSLVDVLSIHRIQRNFELMKKQVEARARRSFLMRQRSASIGPSSRGNLRYPSTWAESCTIVTLIKFLESDRDTILALLHLVLLAHVQGESVRGPCVQL